MGERSEQLNSIGVKYLNEKNYVAAVKYFMEAARMDGNANAVYNLAYCTFNGYGVKKDYALALDYFEQCRLEDLDISVANNGAYIIALIYDNGGYGVESNREIAKNFYLIAANHGHTWALMQYGRNLIIDKDYVNAKKCITNAMQQNKKDYSLQAEGKRLLKLVTLGKISSGQFW